MENENQNKSRTIVSGIKLFLFILSTSVQSNAQDSMSVEQLLPITYTFNIDDGKMTGDGADFLIRELNKVHFTMIGEYHGSARISEFTNSLIPVLDRIGYKTLILEVGPITGQILNSPGENIPQKLKNINEEYLQEPDKKRKYLPIPFFENVEDAIFLQTTLDKEWTVIGIDQEFLFGFQMLIDKMFDNLSKKQKKLCQNIYQQTKDSLSHYFKKDFNREQELSISIKNSKIFNEFFIKMSMTPKNVEIINALKNSNEIYYLNDTHQWYENNAQRVKYMKEQFRTQISGKGLNFGKDKMVIKMGGYHLSKGFSPLGLFEVGNMVIEIAEYYNKSALNICFSNRFYTEDGKVVDILESKNEYYQRLKELNKMGKKDEWVIIDLRQMLKGHFYYPVKYKFNEYIKELVKQYDFLIIPKVEIDPIPNYNQK